MKRFVVIASLLVCSHAMAQKGIKNMVSTEKSFAAYALTTSTRQAFLKFMDSSAILFDKGDTVNGLKLWTSYQERSNKLWWQPSYAEISASNDFGFTTGPWRLYENSIDDTPSAFGHFITIWNINPQHEWKFLTDIGIHYKIATADSELLIRENKKSNHPNATSVMEVEKAFDDAFKKDVAGAYKKYLSANSRLNNNGSTPAISPEEKEKYIISIPSGIQFNPLGSFVSSANDLAAIFGSTSSGTNKESYLHIWRNENGSWKLACEVLHL